MFCLYLSLYLRAGLFCQVRCRGALPEQTHISSWTELRGEEHLQEVLQEVHHQRFVLNQNPNAFRINDRSVGSSVIISSWFSDGELHIMRGDRVRLVLRSRQRVEAAMTDYHNELNHLDINKCLRLLNER